MQGEGAGGTYFERPDYSTSWQEQLSQRVLGEGTTAIRGRGKTIKLTYSFRPRGIQVMEHNFRLLFGRHFVA
jgi:hypothetical protein